MLTFSAYVDNCSPPQILHPSYVPELHNATGIDKISCKIIKIATLPIADSLTYIFDHAITLASFPDE